MRNDAQRQDFYSEMKRFKFDYTPSRANFVMVHLRSPAGPVIEELLKRKILGAVNFNPYRDRSGFCPAQTRK